jgi:hypothetical protein
VGIPADSAEVGISASVPGGAGPAPGRGFLGFLRAHPILCLAILTPGIPEYLSTSSSLLTIGTDPFFFLLQLGINVGQYTAGALLIREAMLRWHKGWGSVFLLALAYGITEEGLGDNTLFNSTHGTDGILGSFGRFDGVNWVWSTAVLAFHVIYSIGLPILLLGLALPQTRGRSLVGRQGIGLAFASLIAATSIEMVIVFGTDHFWLGWALLVGSFVAIGALVVAAYRVPADLWTPRHVRPTLGPWPAAAIGFVFFPIAFVLEYDLLYFQIPAYVVILIELVVFAMLLETVRRGVGRSGNEYLLVQLALGFVMWQALFGVLLTLGLPYTLPLVALAVVFFIRLRRAYAPRARSREAVGPPPVPAGATGRPH